MRLRLIGSTAVVLTLLFGGQAFADSLVVACGRSQRAVVRNTFVRGEQVTRVRCVSDGGYRAAAYRPYRTQYETPYRVARPRRSWAKSALIIGGSAGTGAGIGGIVNGGKGALIGAALGGGAGTLYEVQKR